MPFRARLRKTFSRGSSSAGSESSQSSEATKPEPKILYYKPGEKIPYKYRRPVDQAHREMLESFTFDNAWRPRSWASEVSPTCSRAPSRKSSCDMLSPRPAHMQRVDTAHVLDGDYDSSGSDVMSLSTTNSTLDTPSAPDSLLSVSASSDCVHARARACHDTHFSAEDLACALQKSSMQVQQ